MPSLNVIRRRRAVRDARPPFLPDPPIAGRVPARALRRTTLAVALVSLALATFAAVASAGVLESRIASNRSEQRDIKGELVDLDRRQESVKRTINTLNASINELTGPINELDADIADLEARIGHRRQRIVELRVEYRRQRREIARLNAEVDLAKLRMAERLVKIYMDGPPSTGAWLVGTRSIADLVDRQEMVGLIAENDNEIVERIAEMERKVRIKRARNHQLQQDIRDDIAGIREDEAKVQAERDQLADQRARVEALKAERAVVLRRFNRREDHLHERYEDLEEDNQALRDAIENGFTTFNGSVPVGPSPAGLIWPVSGPVVSGFGPRWGRMHEGLDIAVPAGTPIHAAAGGVVTYAGVMSGYGNLVIVQHAGSLSTAYAHQSQMASSVGQVVGQGQVIGFVGCTGHCFGDHLHFETRINGGAVDPMQYL